MKTFFKLLFSAGFFIVYGVNIQQQQEEIERQNYRVRGTLWCGRTPAERIQVKLVDNDFGPDPDDILATGFTNSRGFFELAGSTAERTTIDPYLIFYHDCNDGVIPCQRRWKFELPNHYIARDNENKKIMDIGTWNLEALLPGESHDCLH